jgi:hypothetical protein
MDRNTIRKEITALVNSIKSQSDVLADEKYPSQLELELFLHKIEKLYQKTIVFHHLSLFDGFEESAIPEVVSIPEITPIKREEQEPVKAPVSSQETMEVKGSPVFNAAVVNPANPSQPEKKTEQPNIPKTQGTALPDLKSSIGINDKFQFTNELFKGNMQEFNIAIEQLNASETHESALNYITGLKGLYNWDDENETVKRWLSIIERRYN